MELPKDSLLPTQITAYTLVKFEANYKGSPGKRPLDNFQLTLFSDGRQTAPRPLDNIQLTLFPDGRPIAQRPLHNVQLALFSNGRPTAHCPRK